MNQPFHDHFSGVANRYADFRPHYPAALFDYLATLAPRDSLVWDCAAGNGQATLDLAQRFQRVIATDASREQLAAAPARTNIEYRVAVAESSGLPDGSVALVTVAQAMHWFNLDRFYAEVRRVLKPGGILAVWAYGIDEIDGPEVNKVVLDFYNETVGPYWPPERKVVEQGYRTIRFPFVEITPPEFQMKEHWTMDQLLGYCSTWSATTRFIKAKGRNPIEPLAAALSDIWGGPGFERVVTWPLALRVGKV